MERVNTSQAVVSLSDETDIYTIAESDFETLTRAFQSFNRASKKLQKKYEELRAESSDLRSQLAKKEAQIQKQEQLATLGKTAAALAHEIRNPLGAITLYVSLLEDDFAENNGALEIITALKKSIGALDHVVTNILQFAQHHSNTFSPTPLDLVLDDLCQELRKIYPEMSITFRSIGNLYVWGDARSLRQMFHNLLLNSIQAQHSHGAVKVVGYGNGTDVIVRMRDYGPGFSHEVSEEIFEPFMTTKQEGTGLGLAICREIARAHRAELSAQNWTHGAEMKIRFTQQRGGVREDE